MSAVPDNPIGIVCSLREEASHLLGAFKILKEEKLNGCRCFRGEYKGRQVWLVISGMGRKRVAKATQSLIDYCWPACLINFGTAGGVAPGVRVGEVIVSRQVIAYDSQPAATYQGDSFLVEQVLSLPGVRGGIIASADNNVETPGQRAYMWQTYQALCCDWESAAVLQAAQRNSIPAITLRVISDIGGKPLLKEFKANLPQVVAKGSQVLLELIQKL